MPLGIIGAVLLLGGLATFFQKAGTNAGKLKAAGSLSIALGIAAIGSSMFTVIGVGEVGVVHAFGRVDRSSIGSGIHFVRPWAQVEKFSVREIQFPGGGRTETMDALSREQMAVDVEVAVRYQIGAEDVVALYQTIGGEAEVEAAVLNAIRAGVRDGMAKHGINDIEFRDSIATSMSDAVQEKLATADSNVTVARLTQLFLRKITPPREVAASINAKIQQEQQIQTESFAVQVEEQRARQRVTEAQGIADAQRIINSTLTPQYLMREYITSLRDASENSGTVIIYPTEGGTPILDMRTFRNRVEN